MSKDTKLNQKEASLVQIAKRAARPLKLAEFAAKAFAKKGTKSQSKGNSWVRNSLRRPVRLGILKQAGRGTYAYKGVKTPIVADAKSKVAKKPVQPKTVTNGVATAAVRAPEEQPQA